MTQGHRFDPIPLLVGHWKSLLDGTYERYQPDWWARAVLMLVPGGLAAAALWQDWKIAAPDPLLAGVALLAGALVGAFGNLSTFRLKLTEWADRDDDTLQVERDMIDETVSHVLMAALLCAVTAVALVIGTNASEPEAPITGVLAALIIFLGSYVALIFLLVLPRLYAAYVQINNVRDRFNGFTRGRL